MPVIERAGFSWYIALARDKSPHPKSNTCPFRLGKIGRRMLIFLFVFFLWIRRRKLIRAILFILQEKVSIMNRVKKYGSIVYVNFSPYDNAGRILDFLTSSFDTVIHFSYDHLRLRNGRKTNILAICENGRVVRKKKLIPLRTPEFLRFFSLPAVAALIFLQTFFYCFLYQRQHKNLDYYLSVNAFTTIVGIILRKLGLVKESIFWVWDYYPPGYPDW